MHESFALKAHPFTYANENRLGNYSCLKQISEQVTMVIRPPMKDKECWTHEPEYDRYLHVRVHAPEGLEYRELKCVISCGKEIHKTGVLDIKEEASTEVCCMYTGVALRTKIQNA